MTDQQKSKSGNKTNSGFEAQSIERIKSLLSNPDLSPSQRKTLLNLLKRLNG